jgi:hypothetical protein
MNILWKLNRALVLTPLTYLLIENLLPKLNRRQQAVSKPSDIQKGADS